MKNEKTYIAIFMVMALSYFILVVNDSTKESSHTISPDDVVETVESSGHIEAESQSEDEAYNYNFEIVLQEQSDVKSSNSIQIVEPETFSLIETTENYSVDVWNVSFEPSDKKVMSNFCRLLKQWNQLSKEEKTALEEEIKAFMEKVEVKDSEIKNIDMDNVGYLIDMFEFFLKKDN